MRQIDWDKPLSDDDIDWLRQAGIQRIEERIEENRQRFAPDEDELDDEADDETDEDEKDDGLEDMTRDQLKEMADDKDLTYSAKATKAELVELIRNSYPQ